MPICYFIDAEEQRITKMNQPEINLAFLQKMVGGQISLAHMFLTGDCLYVNDGGYSGRNVFHLHDSIVPFFRGNGILVGKETEYEGFTIHSDVEVSYFELISEILFARTDKPEIIYATRPFWWVARPSL